MKPGENGCGGDGFGGCGEGRWMILSFLLGVQTLSKRL